MTGDGPISARAADFSVVVPTWNEEARLPRLLDSLHAESPAPREVVICDGGSEDRTCAFAEAAGARVVRAPRRGRGIQLSLGAREARGALLWFLHADMCVEPGSVAALLQAFEDPTLVACGVRQRIEAEGRVYRWIEAASHRRVRRGLVYGDSALAVRRVDYEAVGGYRDQPLFEDLDLSRRLRLHVRGCGEEPPVPSPDAAGRSGSRTPSAPAARPGSSVRLVESACVTISPRRWERDGPVRRTVWNRLLTFAWRAGVAPERLARYYRPEGTSPKAGRRTL